MTTTEKPPRLRPRSDRSGRIHSAGQVAHPHIGRATGDVAPEDGIVSAMVRHWTPEHLLAAGDGIATRSFMSQAGVHRNSIRRRIADGRLHEVFPGVLSNGPLDTQGRLRAALLYAGAGAVLSHRTAAAIWGLTSKAPTSPFHVSVPNGRRRRSLPDVIVHQRFPRPTVSAAGLAVTTPEDALVGMSSGDSADDVRFAAAEAVRLGLTTPSALATTRFRSTRARRTLNTICEELQAGAMSGGEAKYWRLVVDARLPRPELNVPLHTAGGEYVVDGLWRQLRLGVEIDGRSVHAQERAFDADRTRQNVIHTHGILLIRFTVGQVMGEPNQVVKQTSAALAARAAELRLLG